MEVPRIYLVVNKALKSFDFGEMKKEVEETYGCEVIAVLPLSEDVAALGSSGVFCLRYPEHEFTQLLGEIAQGVLAS